MPSLPLRPLVALLPFVLLCAGACSPSSEDLTPESAADLLTASPENSPEVASARAFVDGYLAAFNRHSPTEMAGLVHPEIEVYYVDDAGVAALGTKGREVLATELEGYFRQLPDVASQVAGAVAASGNGYLSYTERVSWTSNGTPRAQSSLTVLQLDEGGQLLRRAWYFPAQAEALAGSG